jgi:hypothetical protein
MWIFLNNSFLSIVAHRNGGDMMLVRSRVDGDIEAVFPNAKVIMGAGSDYLFRATVSRTEVKNAMIEYIDDIDYGNFKNSVSDNDRKSAYMDVWTDMFEYQWRENRPQPMYDLETM